MNIISAEYIISSTTYKQCPVVDQPEFAFIGRSNVGKSSLINMVIGKKGLAKTSATPGKTQLINHFEIKSSPGRGPTIKWYVVDLPGYGYATVSHKARNNWSNMIESYIRKRENLVSLFVLIDSRHTPQPIDLEFINQLGEWQVPFVIVFTKADKNKPGATKRNVEKFITTLGETWETPPLHIVTSAVDKTGKEEMLKYINNLNSSFTKR